MYLIAQALLYGLVAGLRAVAQSLRNSPLDVEHAEAMRQ
jgi:hypothetical protein